MAKGKTYRVLRSGFASKREAVKAASFARRAGYERVKIVKKRNKYDIWAFY